MRVSQLELLMGVCTTGMGIYLMLRLVAYLIGQTGDTRKIRCQFVPEWIAGTYIAFGIAGVFLLGGAVNSNSPYPDAAKLAALGLVVGLVIGLIDGTIRVRSYLASDGKSYPGRDFTEDGNPYRPP